jgi:hypothetical protein
MAIFDIVYTGDNDKRNWPKYNDWVVYHAYRGMSSELQELLGFDWEHSPTRALLPKNIYVSRVTGAKSGGGDTGPSVTPDQAQALSNRETANQAYANHFGRKETASRLLKDNTKQELKDLQTAINRFHQKLDSMEIFTHEDMPSQYRRIRWIVPGRSKPIPCECTNVHFCECILKALKLTAQLEKVVRYEKELQKLGHAQHSSVPWPVPTHSKRSKQSQKDLLGHQRDVQMKWTAFTIGEINRKGAGRKEIEEQRVSGSAIKSNAKQNSWQRGANNQNAAQLKASSIIHGLSGKRGRIRGNLGGKRVEKNGRTVAGGSDALVRINNLY